MTCPTCGLVNPPESLRCDCGYDFKSSLPSDTPGWAINLTWRQQVAAYWSISWPAWLVTIFALGFVMPASTDQLLRSFAGLRLIGLTIFFATQAVLTHRLVRKNYRTFRVYVIRENGEISRRLSVTEGLMVWLCILWPQLTVIILSTLIYWGWGSKIPADLSRSLSALSVWFQILVLGPLCINLAMRVYYSGFRLQAYGFRYI